MMLYGILGRFTNMKTFSRFAGLKPLTEMKASSMVGENIYKSKSAEKDENKRDKTRKPITKK